MAAEEVRLFREMERRMDRLQARAEDAHGEYLLERGQGEEVRRCLALAPKAEKTLADLTTELFGEILDEIEANLTHAVREILGQERRVVSSREVKNSKLNVEFSVENEGNAEHILKGQGGSVCNVLSVSLRLIALSQLDPARHRPFLVLDEQACWLKPALVPRLKGIVARIAEKLGLQVLVISHHSLELLREHAQAIYELQPDKKTGVVLREVMAAALSEQEDKGADAREVQ